MASVNKYLSQMIPLGGCAPARAGAGLAKYVASFAGCSLGGDYVVDVRVATAPHGRQVWYVTLHPENCRVEIYGNPDVCVSVE